MEKSRREQGCENKNRKKHCVRDGYCQDYGFFLEDVPRNLNCVTQAAGQPEQLFSQSVLLITGRWLGHF